MTISIGSALPEATLYESTAFEGSCPVSPERVQVLEATRGKKIVIFSVPGAFTPTCSNKHLPGYVEQFEKFKALGVNEVWCVSVNDGFTMAAWGQQNGALGKVRMFGDGNGDFARALGLELDLHRAGMGVRMQRCAMYVENGVVKVLRIESSGGFEVSDANTMIGHLEALRSAG